MAENIPNYFKPVINVSVNGVEQSLATAHYSVDSDLRGKADRCRIMLEDQDGSRGDSFVKGNALEIQWGYEDGSLTRIFQGVVLDSNHSNPLEIRGIDYNTISNAVKIKQTYQDDTVSGIMKAILIWSGLELEIEDCDVVVDRIPFFNRTIRECVDSLSTIAKRESGEEYFDYIRDGVFHWGKMDFQQAPSAVFTTGVNIIDFQLNEDGLSELLTMITPVQHSRVIQIDGADYFVEKVEYVWKNGGRTRMGVNKIC